LKWANIAKNEKDYNAQFGDGAYASTTFDWERNVVIGVSKFKDDFVAGLLDVITEILQWINYFAFMVMYLMSFLFRICLRAVAPIAIGIAIFDGFSNNAVEWLGKYINYALLPAIANLYGAISFNILTKMMITLTSAGIVGDENAKNTSYDITTMGAVYVAVLVVLIIGWFFIPTIANMVVSVGGSSAAAQGFAARSAALGAGATAGTKMAARGGVITSGAITGGIKEGYAGAVNGGKAGMSMGQNTGMGNYGSTALGMASAIGGGIYNGAIGAFKGGGDANVAAKKMRRRASYRYGGGRYGA
jgi:type IV secretory pathway VirB6-like protein